MGELAKLFGELLFMAVVIVAIVQAVIYVLRRIAGY